MLKIMKIVNKNATISQSLRFSLILSFLGFLLDFVRSLTTVSVFPITSLLLLFLTFLVSRRAAPASTPRSFLLLNFPLPVGVSVPAIRNITVTQPS